jgi:hypothetical protein
MSITAKTRRESFNKTKETLGARHREIYDLLADNPAGLSAWDIASITGRAVYVVRPRLTELCSFGMVQVSGMKYHAGTDRNEAVWTLVPEKAFDQDGQGQLFNGAA